MSDSQELLITGNAKQDDPDAAAVAAAIADDLMNWRRLCDGVVMEKEFRNFSEDLAIYIQCGVTLVGQIDEDYINVQYSLSCKQSSCMGLQFFR